MKKTEALEVLKSLNLANLTAEQAAALQALTKPKESAHPDSMRLNELEFGVYRSRVLRNIGFMNIGLLDSNGQVITLGEYRAAAAKYIAANPPKAKSQEAVVA